ncbi:hypothetical protein, partial [Escherichia coli]|uniref:hypothetical protein n=1 Tax=Escherichia coli TaxID=562 RepID=UPI0020BEABE2
GGFTPSNYNSDNPKGWVVNGNIALGSEITGPPNAVSGEVHGAVGYTIGGSRTPRQAIEKLFPK